MAYTLTDTHVHVDGTQHQSVFSPKPNEMSRILRQCDLGGVSTHVHMLKL